MGKIDEVPPIPYRDEEEELGAAPQNGVPEEERRLNETENGHTTREDDTANSARWKSFTEPTTGFISSLAPTNVGFYPTVRAIFNYPPPDAEFRSTAWLDGLRGLAAFEVFVFHYCDGWMENRPSWGPVKDDMQGIEANWWLFPGLRTLYASGDGAVCLFFAISGYALSNRMMKLLRQHRSDEFYTSLSSAVFRRGIRLYLPVAIETLVLMLACRLLGVPKPVEYLPEASLWLEFRRWWVSMVHLFLPLRWPALWYDVLNRYDGHISWTIPLEFHGSLVTYLVLLGVSRIHSMFARHVVIWVVICHAYAKDDWISAQFLTGMVLGDWHLHNEENKKKMEREGVELSRTWLRFKKIFFPLLFCFGFFMAGLPPANFNKRFEGDVSINSRPGWDWIGDIFVYLHIYGDRQADRYLLGIAGMCSMIAIAETPFLRRITVSRPIQYLGKISFGLYLCHIFMRAFLRPLNTIYLGLVGLTLDDLLPGNRQASPALFIAFCMHLFIAIPPNLIMGGLFERFLDTPSVNAAKRLEKYCIGPAVKKDILPTSSAQGPQTPTAASIPMVNMGSNGRAVRPPAVSEASRASLPPPTDFEEEEETSTSRRDQGRVRL